MTPMNPDLFADLDADLDAGRPDAAIDRLIAHCAATGDADGLFYARLLQARVRLGVDPAPTRPTSEMPEATHEPYEEAIRAAGREAARLCLDRGDVLRAWGFCRLLQEPEPVRAYLAGWSPPEGEDINPYLDLALQQGVAPLWGLELLLARQGVCSALSGYAACAPAWPPADRAAGAARLAHAVREQLAAALAQSAGTAPAPIPELLDRHPDLMGDDAYYIDLSHLAAVVQLCVDATDPATLAVARELCAYGRRLPERFRRAGDGPLATYDDFADWFAARSGDDAALERFAARAGESREAAEAYVNLLLHRGRAADALAVARERLADVPDRELSCPGLYQLADGDPAALADIARARGDAVHYLAARLRAAARGRP